MEEKRKYGGGNIQLYVWKLRIECDSEKLGRVLGLTTGWVAEEKGEEVQPS
jgi:hypothetical protein